MNLHNLADVIKAADHCPLVGMLDQAKAGIWRKFSMPNYHKVQIYVLVQIMKSPPTQVPEHV